MKTNIIYLEDCKETMRKMDANSLPFIITDPPYLLEFMGKEFDSQHHSYEGDNTGQKMQKWHTAWLKEAYRVLKPGGYIVAFGGTRTYHRLACAMEDVGFEIRDTMQWIYGSGFPKSLDISKAIDKRKGAERKVIGNKRIAYPDSDCWGEPNKNVDSKGISQSDVYGKSTEKWSVKNNPITKPTTPEAKKWDGWGTALKPAYEPIVIGMKSVSGSFVDNALNEGVAGINIDLSRVATDKKVDDMLRKVDRNERQSKQWRDGSGFKNEHNELTGVREDGRFPANVILQHHEECKKIGTKKVKGHKGYPKGPGGIWKQEYQKKNKEATGFTQTSTKKDNEAWEGHADKDGLETIENWECHEDCPVRIMNEQSGNNKSSGGSGEKSMGLSSSGIYGKYDRRLGEHAGGLGDFGGAARFYYTAKASKSERNVGLDGMEKKKSSKMGDGIVSNVGPGLKPGETESGDREAENFHPTVKPIDLMRYLVNMFSTPDGGVVYDPFAGSGSTLIACKILGREYIGSEMEPEYYKIAKKRLQYDWVTWWARGKKDDFVKVKEDVKNKFF